MPTHAKRRPGGCEHPNLGTSTTEIALRRGYQLHETSAETAERLPLSHWQTKLLLACKQQLCDQNWTDYILSRASQNVVGNQDNEKHNSTHTVFVVKLTVAEPLNNTAPLCQR